jgi:hypothetical protein
MSRIRDKAEVAKPFDQRLHKGGSGPGFYEALGKKRAQKYLPDQDVRAPWRNGGGDVVNRPHFKRVADNLFNYEPVPVPPEQGPGTQHFHENVNRTYYPSGMAGSDRFLNGVHELRDAIRKIW